MFVGIRPCLLVWHVCCRGECFAFFEVLFLAFPVEIEFSQEQMMIMPSDWYVSCTSICQTLHEVLL